MTTAASVELLVEPRERPVGSGTVRRLLPVRQRRMVGPFVFADIMGPESMGPGAGMDVDAHPHIGLSTLTYLLRGRAVHRDSTGAVQSIDAGAVNWMTAGGGVCHTERSHPDDRDRTVEMFGVQTWVALPDEAEDGPPSFEHCPPDAVPEATGPGATVRLAAGEGFGLQAPVRGSSPLVLAELGLAGGVVTVPADHPERAVLVLEGDLTLDGHPLPVGHLAVLATGSQPRCAGTGTAIVLGGESVGHRSIWWNFVHSDPDRLEDARRQWQDQDFPLVPDDHHPWVPAPPGPVRVGGR